MPRALPSAVRKAICNRSLAGKPSAQIAKEFQVSPRTIRRLLREFRAHGEQALEVSYEACGVRRSADFAKIRRRTIKLRQQHPKWGGGRLSLELKSLYPNHELPCPRTLQRWLREEGLSPAPSGRPSASQPERSDRVHQVWQVDAAEQKRLASGKMISWLRMADECSGAVLKTVVFSRGPFHTRPTANSSEASQVGFCRVGHARKAACRQRRSLGVVERSATGAGFVVDWTGRGDALERSQLSRAKRGHRTQPRVGKNVGRTWPMPNCSTVSKPHQPGRSPPARTVSAQQWPATNDHLSGPQAFRPPLQRRVGTAPLELGSRTDASGWLRRVAPSRQFGEGRLVQRQTVRRHAPQRAKGLRSV